MKESELKEIIQEELNDIFKSKTAFEKEYSILEKSMQRWILFAINAGDDTDDMRRLVIDLFEYLIKKV